MSHLDNAILRVIRTNMGRYDYLERALPEMSEQAKQDLVRLLDNVQRDSEADGRRKGRREFGRVF